MTDRLIDYIYRNRLSGVNLVELNNNAALGTYSRDREYHIYYLLSLARERYYYYDVHVEYPLDNRLLLSTTYLPISLRSRWLAGWGTTIREGRGVGGSGETERRMNVMSSAISSEGIIIWRRDDVALGGGAADWLPIRTHCRLSLRCRRVGGQ